MALRFQRLSRISRCILPLPSGNCGCRRYSVSLNLQRKCMLGKINEVPEGRDPSVHGYSTVTSIVHEPPPLAELLSFIYSSLDEVEGPSHRWLNKVEGSKCGFKKDGIFFICAAEFVGNCTSSDCSPLTVFEKVKLLKQRYPSLQVMGLQYCPSILSDAACTNLIRRIMTEYITFPVLLSNKDYSERIHGACYIMFKGLQSPLIYHDKDVDFATLDKAANTLIMENDEVRTLARKLESSWMNPAHIVKEPYLSSFLQNLLLYFPACISSDEEGNRLFLSDVNHHRIIILNENGRILDCIGSSPGFEDAEFENAKLMRPAASFYHSQEDCLYFVDSENHAVRKADLERRIVETVYPPSTVKKNTSLWSWILDKLGKNSETKINPEEMDSDSCFVPWHLMKSTNDELFVLSRGLETLWMIDMALGIMKVVRGLPKVLEICGHVMNEKSSLVKQIPNDWLQQYQQRDATSLGSAIPYAGLMSSVAKVKDCVFLCDSGGQMVLKLNQKSGSLSRLQFSNFDILGLPYWLSLPLERVCLGDEMVSKLHVDHTELFRLLPGRVNIKVNIEIPEYLVLVEPLEESSVWCQARGSATDVSGAESGAPSSEKVGIAQQWYDELDSLAFSTSESESVSDVESTGSTVEMQEGRICIRYPISTSPGTSEAIIYASMYVRLKSSSTSSSESDTKYANQLASILDPVRVRWQDSFGKFLLASNKELEGLTLIKPLHIRLKFDCGEHPKAENSKSIILTDSSVEVNVVIR